MTGKLRFTQLTIGEMSFLEERGKLDLANFDGNFTSTQLGALAYVLKKRFGDPTFTWNQALALTIEECQNLLEQHLEADEEADDADPKAERLKPTTDDGSNSTLMSPSPSPSSNN